jgi:carbonic anhydrase
MKKKLSSSLVGAALLAALSLAGCATTRNPDCPRWTYGNQAQWATLCPAYKECGGTTQSPRPLAPNRGAALPVLDVHYEISPFSVGNNQTSYTIEAKALSPKNRLVLGNDTYDLREIHFHNPSEHFSPGSTRPFPVEIHLVHYNSEKKEYAVVAVFMEERVGAPNNPVFEQILENVAKEDIQVNPEFLLPPVDLKSRDERKPRVYYRYLGSKTTPPCDPGVRWNVLAEPIIVPPVQVEALKKFYLNTARRPQRNSEPVFEVKPVGPAG